MPIMAMRLKPLVAAAGLAAVVVGSGTAAGPKFFPDDPLSVERDHQDASKIRPWDIDLLTEIGYALIGNPGDPTPNVRARNVNTVDEVPDSSWFVNRLAHRAVSVAEVTRGPDATSGPDAGVWTVTSSKSNGITPGFVVRDSSGERWFLKFDAPGHRGMATGTEVIVTKLLWALGYHVPEVHIGYLHPERLAIDAEAKFTPVDGKRRPMERGDVAALLQHADREPDGSYRVIASRALPRVGAFRFYDTNPDDPNDIVPHEHRRELRGLRVFAAWLNHVDVKGGNTLDALIKENGRAFVRHYLQDFGSTLGSGSIAPHEVWEGSEHVVEPAITGRQMVGFGFFLPPWVTREYFESPAVGRLPKENKDFDPEAWKPRVPNPAFERARNDDKFWAARRLVDVTDEMISAAVETGALDDPQSEAFLVRVLIERRDAIVRAYLRAANPIESPAFDGQMLTFRNIVVDRGLASRPAGYRATWSTFDNATQTATPIGETTSEDTRLPAPSDLLRRSGVYMRVELSARGAPHPSWEVPAHIYFVRQDTGWRLVGFERVPAGS
jgi:hypothetical protein